MCGIALTGGTWTLWLPAHWWGHRSQWECLWNACSITADRRRGTAGRGRRDEKRRSGTCSGGRGVDDRLCGGGGEVRGGGGVYSACLLWAWGIWRSTACVHVMERTGLALKKKKRLSKGVGVPKLHSQEKSHKMAENVPVSVKTLCFSLITCVSVSNCYPSHFAELESHFMHWSMGSDKDQGSICQNAVLRPEAGLIYDKQNKACYKPDDCLLSFHNCHPVTITQFSTKRETSHIWYMKWLVVSHAAPCQLACLPPAPGWCHRPLD